MSIAFSTMDVPPAGREVRATCSSGSETTNFASGATALSGLSLANIGAWTVVLEGQGAGTVAGGYLRAYFYNSVSGHWNRAPDFDITVPAVAAAGYAFLGPSAGWGIPVIAKRDRVAFVPDSVTAASGCYVDLNGTACYPGL